MAIEHTKVATIPSAYAVTCSIIAGGFCGGSGSHMCFMSEQPQSGGVPHDFNQQIWTSVDDGVTWAKQNELVTTRLWLCPPSRTIVAPRRFLVGTTTPTGSTNGIDDFVTRSQDLGATWTTAVSPISLLTLQSGQVFSISSMPNGHVIAFGRIVTIDGTVYHTLRSTDGGATFLPWGQVAALTAPGVVDLQGLKLSIVVGTRIWSTAIAIGDTADLYYSDDEGLTWNAVTTNLPDPSGQGVGVTSFAHQDGRLFVGGGRTPSGAPDNRTEPVVYASTDNGLSWTESVIPGYPFDASVRRYFVHGLVAMGSGHLFAHVSSDPTTTGSPVPFAVSRDNGVNWTTAGNYTGSLGGALGISFNGWQADDGSVINTITRGGGGEFAGGYTEIWRSVVDQYRGGGSCVPTSDTTGTTETGSPCQAPARRRLGACVDDLTDKDIIRARWQAGDRMIINRVIFSIDWDAVNQQFTKHVVYTFNDSVKKYGLRPAMRIESHGIRSTPTACGNFGTVGCGIGLLDERAFALGARYADPPPMLNLEVFYRKHTWEPSDIICVTSAYIPNIVTGRRGIQNEAFEIINIQQQFAPEGKVILTLLDVEAITLPPPPSRFIAKDEVDMLLRMREKDYRLTEIPPQLREFRRSSVVLLEKAKKPGKNPPPPDAGFDYVHDPRGYFPGAP
jgi:hypothetical protein